MSLEEIVVTAQRREETLQSVPIAVSAFSQSMLQRQQIDGGPNLQRAVPNVTFTKNYYSGYNFAIRGIGTKQTSATGDSSTGVHFNGAPLTENRLFEAEFFDVERVEVLRGPQGTLYGRNATGGVVNVISAKPTGEFEGMIRGEVGEFDTRKLSATLNVPLMGEVLGLRIAGTGLNRSGYATNLATGNDVDGRNLYSVRTTLGFKPSPKFEANLVWQHFQENDDRLRTGRSICTRDNGPSSVGGVAVNNAVLAGFLSRGCGDGSIYSTAANGTANSLATLPGVLAFARGLSSGDAFAGKVQSNDRDTIESAIDPKYFAKEDVVTFNAAWHISDVLTLESLTSYYKGKYQSDLDEFRTKASVPFNSTPLAPGGVVNDAQLGNSNLLMMYDSVRNPAKQWTQELRFSSSMSGPLNFSVGAIYLDYKKRQDVYVLSNAFTYSALAANGGVPCAPNSSCIYINPNQEPNDQGHGTYLSRQPYQLKSKAVFGEIYYELADTLRLTGGLRYTNDRKVLTNVPVKLLNPGSGMPIGSPPEYVAQFKEVTGRAGFDWSPDLAATSKTLIYGFYSRGYKGGGPNNVGQTVGPRPFYDPEFVNSFEIGTKNTLLDGRMTLNAAAFLYRYKGYQISKFVNRVSTTENIDADIKGLEFESTWEPINNFRMNASLGLLGTKIKSGVSIDPVNRTQGDPNLTFVKTSSAGGCVAPTAALANFLNIIQQGPGAPTVAGVSGNPAAILGVCSGTYASLGVIPTEGVAANLNGKDLPNSPKWTLSLGAQYTWELSGNWAATVRGDYFKQGSSYARVFNLVSDRLRSWDNANVSVEFENADKGLKMQVFAKNVFNKRSITDVFRVDDAFGLAQDAFFLDPRIIGVAIQKNF